jgi:DNA topoisomerase-3
MKKLVIAEKPSVAADIARVLGVKKKGDFYENEQYVISSAVGHLVELFMPDDIDKKFRFWSIKDLPIIPEKFQLKPIEKTKDRLDELKRLLKRDDVEAVINACDAGREGELIFTYIYELSKSKLPKYRLWLSSMTPESIKQSFKDLRDDAFMLPLRDAARCRSESDWLIGINGTRAMTSRIYGVRARQAASVGRVQTPTLSMVIDREKEIRSFVARPYWRIVGEFGIHNGQYQGVLQRPDYKKNEADQHDRVDRFWAKEEIVAIHKKMEKQPTAVVTEEKKRSKQASPRLYDLTTLQREANNRFGYPAAKTLKIAQSLYEKHKALTYPRTDSKALPEDYIPTVNGVLKALGDSYEIYADKVLKNGWVVPNKRIFNNKEVSDHFAIIPTEEYPSKLSDDEAKIYDMVTRRFLAIFFPPAEYDVTTRISQVDEYAFKTEGKVLAVPGWLEVHGKEGQAEETLPALSPQDGNPVKAKVVNLEVEEDQTRPPPRYTEATLLAAMEGAGKFVDDEELAEAMKEKGLGTPATRAQIIDHLCHEKYLERDQRELIPTPRAEHLIEFLHVINIEALASPKLTGEWEYKLRQIQEGKLSREEFMKGIADMTRNIVEQARGFAEDKTQARVTDIISPTDNLPMLELMKCYQSQDEKVSIYKIIGNRKMLEDEVKQLLANRKIGPIDDFRSKAGRPFSAMLELNEENKVKFVFESSGGAEGEEGAVDLSQFPSIAGCPLAKLGLCSHKEGQIKETPNSYMCEHYNPKESKCNFRVSRTLLERTIPREQFIKLVENGKTDLLDKFRSKRTKRYFSAHLILKDDGKIGFEFAPKAPKEPKAPKKAGAVKRAKKVVKMEEQADE